MAEAESQLANDGEKVAQAKQIIDLALDLAKDCAASYRKARPDVRKMWNRAFFQTVRVRDGAIIDFKYEEPSRPSSVRTKARWWTQGDSNP